MNPSHTLKIALNINLVLMSMLCVNPLSAEDVKPTLTTTNFQPIPATIVQAPVTAVQVPAKTDSTLPSTIDQNDHKKDAQGMQLYDFPQIKTEAVVKTPDGVVLDFSQNDTHDAIAALKETDLITVDYPQAEIRSILRNVADLYEINLVIPEKLVGNTSIKLRNVTWKQIFDIILKPVGFTYVIKDDIVRIISLEEINLEPMKIQTFPVKYAKASEVAIALTPILEIKNGASVQVDERTNTLIIKEKPRNLVQIENILNNSGIDKPSLQVMIETKFIEVSKKMNPARNDGLGFDWWSTGAMFGPGNNFLQTRGILDFFNNFVRPVAASAMGAVAAANNSNSTNSNTSTTTPTATGSYFQTAIFSGQEYNMVLTALETLVCSRLVADPTIVTLNNKTATFHVGEKLPIIEANYDPATGNFTVGNVQYLDVGVKVDVTPRVNAGAEQITLMIKPIVNKHSGDVEFTASGSGVVKYPIQTIRDTETNVSIRNGYTLALGGLLQNDESDQMKKVPILGDLPFVGRVFQQKVKTLDKINLIMFITAKVLDPNGSSYLDVVDPRQLAVMGISEADIPGYANGIEMPGMTKMSMQHRRLLDQVNSLRTRIDDRNARECLKDAQVQMIEDEYPPCGGRNVENSEPVTYYPTKKTVRNFARGF